VFLFDHVVNKFLGWYQRVFSGEEMVIMSTQCVLTPNRPSVGPGSAPRKASADFMIMIGPAALVLVFFIAALSCASYLFQEIDLTWAPPLFSRKMMFFSLRQNYPHSRKPSIIKSPCNLSSASP